MSSDKEKITAMPSRASGYKEAEENYQVILPTLPAGDFAENTVIFHGDVAGRPYRLDDFKSMLKAHISGSNIAAFCAYQMNHVWLLTTKDPDAKQKPIRLKECHIKRRRCLIFDAEQRIITVRVHWLPFHVADEEVKKVLSVWRTQ